MGSNDISAYTYERTLLMEQRVKLLKEMKLMKRDSLKNNVCCLFVTFYVTVRKYYI